MNARFEAKAAVLSTVFEDLQSKLPAIFGGDPLYHYIVKLAEASRRHPDVSLGASPRAALSLMRCARARAALKGIHPRFQTFNCAISANMASRPGRPKRPAIARWYRGPWWETCQRCRHTPRLTKP